MKVESGCLRDIDLNLAYDTWAMIDCRSVAKIGEILQSVKILDVLMESIDGFDI